MLQNMETCCAASAEELLGMENITKYWLIQCDVL